MRAMTAAVVTQGIQARFLHQSAFRQRHARRSTSQALPAIWKIPLMTLKGMNLETVKRASL